jgi:hypothetical protein
VGGKSKSQITNQLAMSVEEAHMILNVKKEESMEKILEVSNWWRWVADLCWGWGCVGQERGRTSRAHA